MNITPDELTTMTTEINERIAAHHAKWGLGDPPELLAGMVEIAFEVLYETLAGKEFLAGLEPDHTYVHLPTSPPVNGKEFRTGLNNEALRAAVEAEMKRLAEKLGHRPTVVEWNGMRDRSLPTVTAICNRFSCNWSVLQTSIFGNGVGGKLTQKSENVQSNGGNPTPVPVTAEAVAPVGVPQPAPATHQEAMRIFRQELKSKLFATLKELAVDGQMPSMAEYNKKKPEELLAAGEIMNRLAYVDWGEVAKDAGLNWFAAKRQTS